MAGWKIELSDDLTQTVPAYRWSQISTVSGHCLHFRSICSSKNCFAYQSSLVKSGKPPFNSCLCPKQGKNMVHSGRMHQRKQQIKPRQNRIYKRFIVTFCYIGVARLELAASCSQSRRATNCATPRKNEYYHTIPFFCAFVKCAECRNLPGAPKTTLTLYFCLEAEPKMVYYKVY